MLKRSTVHARETASRAPQPPLQVGLLEHAALLLSSGQPEPALQVARRALAAGLRSAALCNLAGVCAASLGRHLKAQRFWEQAIAIDPAAAQAHFNLGRLHASQRRDEEAERCYRRAIALDPRNAGAHCNLGILLERLGREREAEPCHRQAAALDPGSAAMHCNLGALLSKLGHDAEAERCHRAAIALDPRDAGAHSNLGILLARQKRDGEAEQCYRSAIALEAGNATAHANLALLLEASGREAEAEFHHRQALAIEPDNAQVHSNLGNLLARFRRDDEAERCYLQALAIDPRTAVAHSNLGTLLAQRGREAEAERCFRRAIEIDPSYPLARLNLGFLLLSQGRFEEGWVLHETRYDPRLPGQEIIPFHAGVDFPQWQGESLAGKSLLVLPEQGLGDEIQFCRYVPLLQGLGAARITLACRPPLEPLMQTLEGADAVIAVHAAAGSFAPHDYWTYPLSIPLHCRTTVESIPAPIPYLRAAGERVSRWMPRLPQEGFRVGLAWKGNAGHDNDRNRSLPGLATLAALWSVPGVRFVSLQKGQAEDEARNPPPGQALLDLGCDIADFADTAAIVAQLDLVICVDTSVAHLAGALGIPCWVLLPARKTDWRWMHARSDSPWYPGSMRLFRQAAPGEWAPVVAEVERALRDEAAKS